MGVAWPLKGNVHIVTHGARKVLHSSLIMTQAVTAKVVNATTVVAILVFDPLVR